MINKQSGDSSLENITDAQIRVPWLGRILGFGDLVVMTASEAGINNLRALTDPIGFKKAMMETKTERMIDLNTPRGTAQAQLAAAAAAAAAPPHPPRRPRPRRPRPLRPRPRRPTRSPRPSPRSPRCAIRAPSRPRSTRPRRPSCSPGSSRATPGAVRVFDGFGEFW